jgi:uncharacterized protein YdaU (DUF1376 family)
MSERPWYRRYGSDFIAGTLGLSLEEKGAYSIILDLIYDRGKPIPDEPRYIAGVCGCSVRKWSAIRDRLVALGKIEIEGGLITNRRAEKELENSAKTARKLAENGAKGGDKRAENASARNENNNIAQARLKHRALKPEPYPEEDTHSLRSCVPASPVDRDEPEEVTEAFEAYNFEAKRAGWPIAAKLTAPRRAGIKARLKDAGGLDGWRNALARARGSPHLTGRNDRGWTADLDFFLQAQSFIRLIEGRYDDRAPKPRPDQPRRASAHDGIATAISAIFGPDDGDFSGRLASPGHDRGGPILDLEAAGGAFAADGRWS